MCRAALMWVHWLHPTVVHFAIGLLFTAALLDVFGLWRSSEKLLFAGYWNTVLGAVAAIVAIITGIVAENALGAHDEIGGALLPFHRIFAWAGTVLAVALAAARLAMKGYIRPKLRTLYLTGSMLSALLIFLAGAFGGALVYAYGLGVSPAAARRVLEVQPAEPPPADQVPTAKP